MSDKVRGALFNTLGDIEGLSFLDAFAGSGALAFEALSRGAASVVAIDHDRAAQRAITETIASLGAAGQIRLVKASAQAWLQTTNQQFDVVLCDPPYDDVQPALLTQLAERATAGGLVVLSLPPTSDFTLPEPGYQLLATKNYGDAQLTFYRSQ